MGTRAWVENLMPFAAMVVAESMIVGISTISKAAMSRGMSPFVLVVYADGLGCLLLLPAVLISMGKNRLRITFLLLAKLFVLGLIAVTMSQNLLFAGLNYSSPTLASVITNLVPALTFLLAVIFRMEKVDLRCFPSQIKILGTIVTVLGALTMTLYRGPALWVASSPSNMLTHAHPSSELRNHTLATTSNWVIGSLLFMAATFAVATSNILQAPILKGYPSEVIIVFFYSLFGTIQCAAISLISVRDPNAWKLRSNVELLAVLFTAIFGNVMLCLTAWCIGKKGPVFVCIFKPLEIALAALTSVIFLGDVLHVGSVVGAIITLAGFYGVIWAQYKDNESDEKHSGYLPSSTLSQKTPLLDIH